MILKRFLFVASFCSIAFVSFSQTCTYNITLSGNGATCLQNDTLVLTGALSASNIVWYKGSDSIGVATLAPYTVAGRKTGNGSGITPALLNQPSSVFVDRSGNIYISDMLNNRIQKWMPGATEGETVAGGFSIDTLVNADKKVIQPEGLFLDSAGNMYVVSNGGVQKWASGAMSGVTVINSNAGQFTPIAIYVSRSGNIYVTDINNQRVEKWLPGATSGITVAGGNGFGDAPNQVLYPVGIFVDENENVYVSDAGNNRVQKWLPGATSGITIAGGNGAGNAANQLNSPWGIYGMQDGTIFIADRGNARVQKWVPNAVEGITVAGGNGFGNAANQLTSPSALWLDSANNMFIADAGNHRIQKWQQGSVAGITVAGSLIGSVAATIAPVEAVTDTEGNLYIGDGKSNSVLKFVPGATDGIIVAGGNGNGNNANQLSLPSSIFIDSNNNIYVSDTYNHRVQKWLPGATQGITVAGGNGQGAAANQLNNPQGIFVDAGGTVFIADVDNNRVQKWIPGAVSGVTVAGGNGFGSNANQLWRPVDVFIDRIGNLYVSDRFNNRVQKWEAGASSGITVAGGAGFQFIGSGAHQLRNPYGIFVDDSLNLLIADWHNHRIQQFAPGAFFGTTVAGSASYYGSLSNQLLTPGNIHKDKHGNLFIVDTDNNVRVQKWPNVVDTTFKPVSPGNYSAVITGRNPVCTATSNTITVNTGYTYQFTGNGNWSSPGNWVNGVIPPGILPACSKVIVSPSGDCILDIPQTISAGANITVVSGSNFVINGNLTIQ
jgi:sugar lactone lactonase YvrE